MYNEYYEIIKIPDLKEREIEAFYINENYSSLDKLLYVLKKGVVSQKMAFITNINFYISSEESVNSFFEFINEKIYSLECEVQMHLFDVLNKLFLDSNSSIIVNIKEKHINYLLIIIVKLIIEDEKNKVSFS